MQRMTVYYVTVALLGRESCRDLFIHPEYNQSSVTLLPCLTSVDQLQLATVLSFLPAHCLLKARTSHKHL